MRITLIYPAYGKKMRYDKMQPLGIATLKSFIPKEYCVKFYDDRIEDIPYDEKTDLVMISVQTMTAKRAYQIADEYRKRKVKVILGGFHVTLMPEEALEHADSIVVGEAEQCIGKLFNDFAENSLKERYASSIRFNMVGLNPDRTIFKGKKYLNISLVEFGRGCNYNCDFCSVHTVYKGKIDRPIADVINDIKSAKSKLILFVDDNLIANKDEAKKLFEEIIPLKRWWISQVDITFLKDKELMKLAKKSGCFGVLIGFESLNKNNLHDMSKINDIEEYHTLLENARQCSINICASFVFGYEQDNKESFNDTLNFLKKERVLMAMFNHLTPFPKTRLYTRLNREGRLINKKWWVSETKWGEVFFKPTNIALLDLEQGCKHIREDFFSYKSIFYRLLSWSNLKIFPLFLLINFGNRRSLKEKQWMDFGR